MSTPYKTNKQTSMLAKLPVNPVTEIKFCLNTYYGGLRLDELNLAQLDLRCLSSVSRLNLRHLSNGGRITNQIFFPWSSIPLSVEFHNKILLSNKKQL